jgi:hypothetical protein
VTTIVLLLVSTTAHTLVSPFTSIPISSMNTACIMTTHLISHIIISHTLRASTSTTFLYLARTDTIGRFMSLVTRINSSSTLIASTPIATSILGITLHGHILFNNIRLVLRLHQC